MKKSDNFDVIIRHLKTLDTTNLGVIIVFIHIVNHPGICTCNYMT